MNQTDFNVIIRCSNQKCVDKHITCDGEWTIEQLKQKIESEYPGNPKTTDQRLIHGGKVLVDEHRIKNVLKKSDQVVHLLYGLEASSQNSPVSNQTSGDIPPTSGTELRHRGNSGQTTENHGGIGQFYAHHWAQQSSMHSYGQYTNHSEAYAQWYQYYNQQMMHYYSQTPHQSQPAEVTEQQPVANNINQNMQNQAENQNMVLNAQGGLAVADDDDFGRDWLDMLFALTRFCLLLSVIYFYSSTYRFIITLAIMLGIYLYQAGAFEINRRPAVRPAQNEDANRDTDDNNNQSGEETENNDPNDLVAPLPPPPPSVFETAWCFVRSFFSSLIPTGPQLGN